MQVEADILLSSVWQSRRLFGLIWSVPDGNWMMVELCRSRRLSSINIIIGLMWNVIEAD